MSEYRFEEEGTQEWLCARTNAPELPAGLCYRVKMTRHQGIQVGIVNPTQRNLLGRKGKTLIVRQTGRWWDREADWSELIGKTATHALRALEEIHARDRAKKNDNPYFGVFCRGSE